MSSVTQSDKPGVQLNRGRVVRFFLSMPVFFALFMFLPAGDFTWVKGWIFIAVFIGSLGAIWAYLSRVNPEVIAARTQSHKDTKSWDKPIVFFLLLSVYSIIPVAALDDGRFHWFPLPWWVCCIGYAMYLVGMLIITRAEAVNKFFEVTVRIQSDRNQYVIDTGPYAIVRHPGYVSGIILFPGTALCLGSIWALIPAGIGVAVIILRTQWEDQTLQAELPGYREYAQRVRYRLIPGVW